MNKLSVAWKYRNDGKPLDIQSNAIVAEKNIYPSNNKKIIALDAKSGKFIWEFLDDIAPRRGMLYLPGKNKSNQNYFFIL